MHVERTPVHRGSAPVVAHPGWCDPRQCFEADGDIQHCSEPVWLQTQDAYLGLAWVRSDEAGAEQPGATELRIDISYVAPGARAPGAPPGDDRNAPASNNAPARDQTGGASRGVKNSCAGVVAS